MVQQVRVNFLNYNPDLEDTQNPGLTVASNVVHDAEGYKPVHLASAGSFVTTGSLGASVATVRALVAKPVGSGDDLFCAWISSNTLQIGLNGVTATSVTTGYPLSFATAGVSTEITAFDVTESNGKIFFVVEATQTEITPSANPVLKQTGYMDY